MTAKVDPQICIGCTLCTEICPGVFRMESDKALAYKIPVPADLAEDCRRASEQCPVTAITIEG